MHNAPSVTYPVGRCAFQRRVYAVLCVCSGAVLIAWAAMQPMGWMWGLAIACWLVACVLGGRACWCDLGQLTWTGQVWCLHGQTEATQDALGDVRVTIDVQGALLLQWVPLSNVEPRTTRWLWLGAENSPQLWQDVRRAVFAMVHAS